MKVKLFFVATVIAIGTLSSCKKESIGTNQGINSSQVEQKMSKHFIIEKLSVLKDEIPYGKSEFAVSVLTNIEEELQATNKSSFSKAELKQVIDQTKERNITTKNNPIPNPYLNTIHSFEYGASRYQFLGTPNYSVALYITNTAKVGDNTGDGIFVISWKNLLHIIFGNQDFNGNSYSASNVEITIEGLDASGEVYENIIPTPPVLPTISMKTEFRASLSSTEWITFQEPKVDMLHNGVAVNTKSIDLDHVNNTGKINWNKNVSIWHSMNLILTEF